MTVCLLKTSQRAVNQAPEEEEMFCRCATTCGSIERCTYAMVLYRCTYSPTPLLWYYRCTYTIAMVLGGGNQRREGVVLLPVVTVVTCNGLWVTRCTIELSLLGPHHRWALRAPVTGSQKTRSIMLLYCTARGAWETRQMLIIK